MNLEDLLSFPDLHIVEAPEQGSSQQLGLNNPQLLNTLKPTGHNIEGNQLVALAINDGIMFALKDSSEQTLTVLIATNISDFPGPPKNTLRIDRSWTPEELRGRGYSTALYDGIAKLGYRLVSDVQLSPEAQRVWDKLSTKRELKFWDRRTRQYVEHDRDNDPHIQYVLEHATYWKPSTLVEGFKFWTG